MSAPTNDFTHDQMLELFERFDGKPFTVADFQEYYAMYLKDGDCEDPDMAEDMRASYPNLCAGNHDQQEWEKFVSEYFWDCWDCVPNFRETVEAAREGNKFTLLPLTAQKPKPDKARLWVNVHLRESEASRNPERLALSGVQVLNRLQKKKPETKRDVLMQLAQYERVVGFIGMLTPTMLLRVFPVSKTYEGKRYGEKDFFSTMEALREHGLDEPIGEKAFSILWDYVNPELDVFLADMLCAMDDVRRANGEKGMIEEFFGLTPHYLHTDSDTGKQYFQNGDTGEVTPVKKKRPRYLKLVQ